MFCPNCGADIGVGTSFCPKCGQMISMSSLGGSVPQPTQPMSQQPTVMPQQNQFQQASPVQSNQPSQAQPQQTGQMDIVGFFNRINKKTAMVILLAVVVCFGGFILFRNADRLKTSIGKSEVSIDESQFLGTWEGEVDTGNDAANFIGGIVAGIINNKTGVDLSKYEITFRPDGSCKVYLGGSCIGSGSFSINNDDSVASLKLKSNDGTMNGKAEYHNSYITLKLDGIEQTSLFKK